MIILLAWLVLTSAESHFACLGFYCKFNFAHCFLKSLEINFALTSFLRTFGLGLVWAWLTLRSGSILLALLAHNLGNGLPNLIRMKFI